MFSAKHLLCAAALTMATAAVHAQTSPATVVDTSLANFEQAAKIFSKVDIDAEFTGGEKAWHQFLAQHLHPEVPVDKGAPAGKYTVVIQFIVSRNGAISDIKPLTNNGYGMEAEVVRVLKQSPRWTPAMQSGRTVNAYRKQPVTFQVIEEKRRRRLF